MSRWITVANRLPFSLTPDFQKESGFAISTSSGGLVSALSGVRSEAERVWIGPSPDHLTPTNWPLIETKIAEKSGAWTYRPVFLESHLYDAYYNRSCNDVLWPLLHYQPELVSFDHPAWEAYREVNRRIAEEIAAFAEKDDLIWIHDFHLFLVPKILRELRPELRIGFFLHVPFPSSEVFRQLPVREEILESLLTADLIGFHDYSYLQHFGNTAMRLLGAEVNFMSATRAGRTVRLGVFPVSIDTDTFVKAAKELRITALAQKLEQPTFQFLGIDRLDYMKGVDLKLKAFRELLINYPQYRGKVSLLQVAVPTRASVPVYQALARETAQLVGEINGQFASPTWTPVQYIHSSVTHDELLALYRAADGLLVTSKRDGMNLVALEYIAAQDYHRPGVVLLSEFAGAVSMLSHTLVLNPWDLEDTANKMARAIEMPKEERVARIKTMRDYLKNYNSTHWATSFIEELQRGEPARRTEGPPLVEVEDQAIEQLADRVMSSHPSRVSLFIDYDGTLTPIKADPKEAVLAPDVKQTLQKLSKYPWLDLVVVSGRESKFLSEQLQDIRCVIAAEHGAKTFDPAANRWRKRILSSRTSWYNLALKIMTDYSARVPYSRVEKKQFSIAWHYRLSQREYGEFQSRKLAEELELGFANMPVSVIRGKKVVEARAIEADKGVFARSFLENEAPGSFAIAIGDDRTDEDLFMALRGRGLSFKVGSEGSVADLALESQTDVHGFIKLLTEKLDARFQKQTGNRARITSAVEVLPNPLASHLH